MTASKDLVPLLRHESVEIRAAVLKSLAKIKGKRAVENIVSALGDQHWWVRRSAALALSAIGTAEAKAALRTALNGEKDNIVKETIINLLEKLKAQEKDVGGEPKTQGSDAESQTPKAPVIIPYKTITVHRLRYERTSVTVSANTLITVNGDIRAEKHGYVRAKDPNDILFITFFRLTNEEKKASVDDLKWVFINKARKTVEPAATCVHIGKEVPVIVAGELDAGAVKLVSDKKEPLLGLVFVLPKDSKGLVLKGPRGIHQEVVVDREWTPLADNIVKGVRSGWWSSPPVGSSLEWID